MEIREDEPEVSDEVVTDSNSRTWAVAGNGDQRSMMTMCFQYDKMGK